MEPLQSDSQLSFLHRLPRGCDALGELARQLRGRAVVERPRAAVAMEAGVIGVSRIEGLLQHFERFRAELRVRDNQHLPDPLAQAGGRELEVGV